METFPDFANYLDGAQNPNATIRQQSEDNIKQCRTNSPSKFVCSLILTLVTDTNSAGTRTSAAILFKNTLINTTQEDGQYNMWYSLTEETRGFIKEALFQQFVCNDKDALKNASICLGIIAAIEVPDGHWTDFLENMAEQATQENMQYRFASIQTLGFLSEFLDQYINKDFTNEQVEKILHSTICNIDAAHPELAQIAIKALQRTISQTGPNFHNKEQRDFIMDGLYRAIAIDDEDIQTVALEALSEVPIVAYNFISEYIPKVGELTMNFINSGATLQSKQIINFWTNLCTEEIAKQGGQGSLNIIEQYHQSLLPIIHQGLELTEYENDDKETEESTDDIIWTVSRASAALLTEFSTLMKDSVLGPTTVFASNKLQGQTWQEHYVGMVALGSIMDGPTQEAIQREIEPAYQTIFHMLSNSQSSRVRQASAWLISQLVKNAPRMVLCNQENLKMLMTTGLHHLEKDHIQVKQFIAMAFHTAWEEAAMIPGCASQLNPYFTQCMHAMLNCLFSLETLSSGTLIAFSNSVNTTLEMCDYSNLKHELYSLLEGIYQKITEFNSASSQLNNEQREVFLNNLCSGLQPCLVRVGNEGINDQMMNLFVDLAINIFQQCGKVMNGGLFIVHGLICAVEERIAPLVSKFIEYIICGLKMENCDAMGTRLSCGLISDLSNAIQADILTWMQPIAQCLQAILTDNNFDSEAKLVTIIAFGDLSLAVGAQEFMQYLPETLNSFQQACQLSLTTSQDNIERALLTKLRIALVEAYISILHGLIPEDNMPQLNEAQEQATEQFATQMWHYLESMVSNQELQFPPDLLKPMFELYLDISSIHLAKISPNQPNGNRRMTPRQGCLGHMIVQSQLGQEMQGAISAVPLEDQQEIRQRVDDVKRQMDYIKEQLPAPPSSNQMLY